MEKNLFYYNKIREFKTLFPNCFAIIKISIIFFFFNEETKIFFEILILNVPLNLNFIGGKFKFFFFLFINKI